MTGPPTTSAWSEPEPRDEGLVTLETLGGVLAGVLLGVAILGFALRRWLLG